MRTPSCLELKLVVVAVGVALTCATPRLLHADEPATPSGDDRAARDSSALADELVALKARQAALEERVAQAEARERAEVDAQKAALKRAVSFSATPGKGLTLTVGGDRFSLSLRSRAQVRDTIVAQDGKPTTNEINVKTVRLWLQGYALTRDLQYGLQLAFGGGDFEAGSSSPVFDAFVEYTRLRDLNLKVGQFYVPFDRARTIREFGLQLVDRPQMVTELSLDRDVGIALSSSNLGGFHGIFGYHLGFFGGEGKNRFGGAGVGFLYTARFVIRPFGPFDDDLEGDLSREKRLRLAIGFAGAYNQSTNRQRSTTGNTLTLGTVDYAHAEADLVLKYAGFSLLAEVLYRKSRQGSLSGTTNGLDTREWSRSALGWMVQAGMMLHKKVELAARYDELHAIRGDFGTDPTLLALVATTGKELGAGINVYLNGHAFKIQADYQYQFGDSVRGGKHSPRIQLDASF